MTINELIEQLQAIAEAAGDVEVRIAQQPSWPFEYSIGSLVTADVSGRVEMAEELYENEADMTAEERAEAYRQLDEVEEEVVVFLGEGRQLGYLGSEATSALGWGR